MCHCNQACLHHLCSQIYSFPIHISGCCIFQQRALQVCHSFGDHSDAGDVHSEGHDSTNPPCYLLHQVYRHLAALRGPHALPHSYRDHPHGASPRQGQVPGNTIFKNQSLKS